jgi:2-polyprenyl-3-methyl-5-hydroxy-6-metoxy-1,4-benzoquinol methylase
VKSPVCFGPGPRQTQQSATDTMSTLIDNSEKRETQSGRGVQLSARMEQFDSFWEGPEDVEKGYDSFGRFYEANYLKHVPRQKSARILVISCGPGYFVNLLNQKGYDNVLGIDSDPGKVAHAVARGLNCRTERAFEYLESDGEPFDAIICEQELNHLTKDEMIEFLKLVHVRLKVNGTLICHGLNGANPIVGAEALAQNFDHFNTFTAYSFQQALEYSGFREIKVFGLHLYVFYANPMNYVAWAAASFLGLVFRGLYILYGKSNKLFTKKIAAVGFKRC